LTGPKDISWLWITAFAVIWLASLVFGFLSLVVPFAAVGLEDGSSVGLVPAMLAVVVGVCFFLSAKSALDRKLWRACFSLAAAYAVAWLSVLVVVQIG